VNPADVWALVFIFSIAVAFISAGVGFGLVKKNVKLSNRLFKVAMIAGSICLFIAIMLILTTQSGGLE
jgi:predicted membrane channel-forming protein YqfA (hemolysin III family)